MLAKEHRVEVVAGEQVCKGTVEKGRKEKRKIEVE